MNRERLAWFGVLAHEEQNICLSHLFASSVIYIPMRQAYFQQLLKGSECISVSAANSIGKSLREKLHELGLRVFNKLGWWYFSMVMLLWKHSGYVLFHAG
ncbi:MAG: hypothetical protein LV471_11465 [Nitrosomonas sp.]|nr:hypothetical protein [Nitrosomonas sp.]